MRVCCWCPLAVLCVVQSRHALAAVNPDSLRFVTHLSRAASALASSDTILARAASDVCDVVVIGAGFLSVFATQGDDDASRSRCRARWLSAVGGNADALHRLGQLAAVVASVLGRVFVSRKMTAALKDAVVSLDAVNVITTLLADADVASAVSERDRHAVVALLKLLGDGVRRKKAAT